jgi:hypothetical protein
MSDSLREKVGRAVDLSGQRFGKLLCLGRVGSKHGQPLWRFRCDCGKEVDRVRGHMKADGPHSCGCINGSWLKGRTSAALKHGQTNTKLYVVWQGIKARCNNPNCPNYPNYGGRGIKLCPEWETDFAAFSTWAHANGYVPGLDTDRIDNDGPYSPDNCRFVERAKNMENRRVSCNVEFGGRTMPLITVLRLIDMPRTTYDLRKKWGWNDAEALGLVDPPEKRPGRKRLLERTLRAQAIERAIAMGKAADDFNERHA